MQETILIGTNRLVSALNKFGAWSSYNCHAQQHNAVSRYLVSKDVSDKLAVICQNNGTLFLRQGHEWWVFEPSFGRALGQPAYIMSVGAQTDNKRTINIHIRQELHGATCSSTLVKSGG